MEQVSLSCVVTLKYGRRNFYIHWFVENVALVRWIDVFNYGALDSKRKTIAVAETKSRNMDSIQRKRNGWACFECFRLTSRHCFTWLRWNTILIDDKEQSDGER